jgi:8-oxo-dGTP pyrophosphatase MutT (NUDIX family)
VSTPITALSRQADAVRTLTDWSAPDEAQEQLRRRFLSHLAEHPDGTERACFPAHLTAGTIVLSSSGDEVLLNLHGKARRWFAFGGHCEDADTTLAATALREALEESGLAQLEFDPVPVSLDAHAVEFCDPRGTVHHLDVRYAAVAADGVEHRASEESVDVRWWPLDALPELEDEMVRLIGWARERLFGT